MSGAGAAVVLPALGAVLHAAPSPSDGGELNSVTVSPGLPGFFAAFVLAVLVLLLAVDMTRRVRRVQAKARVEERYAELEREEAEREATEQDAAEEPGEAPGAPADGTSADGADPDVVSADGTDPAVPTDLTGSTDGDDPSDGSAPEADERR